MAEPKKPERRTPANPYVTGPTRVVDVTQPTVQLRPGAPETTRPVPRTELVTEQNRDALWAGRRDLFFKPATGYGSRAAYRGDKLTKRVWQEIARAPYVAQRSVKPSQRHLGPTEERVFKVDVRVYAYAGQLVLVAARIYQGQTTNFRTAGGGFAPVLTQAVEV